MGCIWYRIGPSIGVYCCKKALEYILHNSMVKITFQASYGVKVIRLKDQTSMKKCPLSEVQVLYDYFKNTVGTLALRHWYNILDR